MPTNLLMNEVLKFLFVWLRKQDAFIVIGAAKGIRIRHKAAIKPCNVSLKDRQVTDEILHRLLHHIFQLLRQPRSLNEDYSLVVTLHGTYRIKKVCLLTQHTVRCLSLAFADSSGFKLLIISCQSVLLWVVQLNKDTQQWCCVI